MTEYFKTDVIYFMYEDCTVCVILQGFQVKNVSERFVLYFQCEFSKKTFLYLFTFFYSIRPIEQDSDTDR